MTQIRWTPSLILFFLIARAALLCQRVHGKNTSRFLAVNLTEAEWQALRAVTPDPCAWMKSQIQRLLDESGVAPVRRQGIRCSRLSLAD